MTRQISFFDGKEDFKIRKPIRLIELFGGIGCQAKALENLNVKFEHYRMCDFDKYAIQSYNAVHGTNFVPSDITKLKAKDLGIVETNKYDYIMTYSFPCTDLSVAGKCAGMGRDSGTRSGLLWEVERLLKECNELPQVLLMENVPQVHGKKNIDNFNEWCEFLESKGYKNYWKDLNAKDFGIPQNRNRTFMVSLLGDYYYNFPEPTKLELRLKDMLEENVDEKYYLSDKMIKYVMSTGTKNFYYKPEIDLEIARPLTTKQDKRAGTTNYITDKLIQVAQLNGFESSGRVYSQDVLAPTINTMGGGQREPKIAEPICIKEATKKGYAIANTFDSINLDHPNSETRRGRVGKQVAQTLTTSCNQGVVVNSKNNIYNLFFTIFDLCGIIDNKEKDKYEKSRNLLSILWKEITKEEIWEKIRRFWNIQEKKILQSGMYEKSIFESRELQSKLQFSTSNSSKHNEIIKDRKKMFNMWENWKIRYTPYRWELSKQQFKQFNLFMSKLSYEETQDERNMQDMWGTDESIGILRKTLSKIQEIWRPINYKIQYRIRKLVPIETWRLMGLSDTDFDKAKASGISNSQLYKQAGNGIVVNVLMSIFKNLV